MPGMGDWAVGQDKNANLTIFTGTKPVGITIRRGSLDANDQSIVCTNGRLRIDELLRAASTGPIDGARM